MPITFSERNADTVEFFPSTTPFPKVATEDYLRQTVSDLLAILQEPKRSIPTLEYGSPITNAYIQLAQILKRATEKPVSIQAPRVAPTTTSVPVTPLDTAPTPRVLSESDTSTFTTMPGISPRVK